MPASQIYRVFNVASDAPAGQVAQLDENLTALRDGLSGEQTAVVVVNVPPQCQDTFADVREFSGGGFFPTEQISEDGSVGIFGTEGVEIARLTTAVPLPGNALAVTVTTEAGSARNVYTLGTGAQLEQEAMDDLNRAFSEDRAIAAGDLANLDLPSSVTCVEDSFAIAEEDLVEDSVTYEAAAVCDTFGAAVLL